MPPTDPQRPAAVDRRRFIERVDVGPGAIRASRMPAPGTVSAQDRKTMVRQAEMMLEMDPPVLPVAYEKIADAWHNKVRGPSPAGYVGIDDVVRWDNGWRAS